MNNIGYLANQKGDIQMALEYYLESLKNEEEIGDKEGITQSLSSLGVIFDKQGEMPKALDYFKDY